LQNIDFYLFIKSALIPQLLV